MSLRRFMEMSNKCIQQAPSLACYALLAVLALGFAACSPSNPGSYNSDPTLRVVNGSGAVLTDVSLTGSGFSKSIDRLEPGETTEFTVNPRGESGVAASFVADGERHHSPEQGYFEASGAYRVTVTIESSLSVTVNSEL